MAAMSEDLAQVLMDSFFLYSPVYLSLHTAAGATFTSADWEATEVIGTNYARVEVDPTDWVPIDPHSITNEYEVMFPVAGSNWGAVTHVGIWGYPEGVPGDPMLYFGGALSASRTVNNGDGAMFSAGNLTVTLK